MEALDSPNVRVDHTDGLIGDESASNAINIADNDSLTALHHACINGHFQVVDYLSAHDADLEAQYV